MRRRFAVPALALALCALVPVFADGQTPPQNRAPVPVPAPPGTAGPPSASVDRTFAGAAMQSNAAEMAEAKIALARSHSTQILGYAQKMIDEHTALDASMGGTLRRLAPPNAPHLAPSDALALHQLQTIETPDFDQAYALDQIGGHLTTLTAFQTEAKDGRDTELVRLTKQWMPTIQSHLQLAVDLTKHAAGDSPFK